MPAKLYSLTLSHPAHAARAMLKRKGIEHEVVNLLPGYHPVLLRLAGFRGGTVPALRIDGRRVQGSRAISRALDQLQPEPALFPADPERRRAVEEAERWGEEELQEMVRRIFRWAVAERPELRRWMAADVVGMPAPSVAAALNTPVARRFARAVGADDGTVQADLAGLPAILDRIEGLMSDGTIGGDEPNAADFQIGSSVRVLLAFEDLRPIVEGRPASDLALRLFPDYPAPIPQAFPAAWLPTPSRQEASAGESAPASA